MKADLKLACDVLKNELEEYMKHGYVVNDVLYKISSHYNEWINTSHAPKFAEMIYDYGGNKGEKSFYKKLEEMILPVKERKFYEDWDVDRYGRHWPVWPQLSWHPNTYYVYVHHSTQTEYGTTYWISENCNRALSRVPIRKTLTPKLKVGKFYKITLVKRVFWGERINGRQPCKYFYDIKEVDENTFIQKGILMCRERF